jgi:hypothetical protein
MIGVTEVMKRRGNIENSEEFTGTENLFPNLKQDIANRW